MNHLYTNRTYKQDFVKTGISNSADPDMDIFIATAFFTEFDVVEELLKKNCRVRIVVRLGFPTSPSALFKLIQNDKIEARYYTSNSFHPKIYIFGEKIALVGSANLTRSALLSNQEVVVGITSEDNRFDEIRELFSEYWDEACVLDGDAIRKYQISFNKFKKISMLIEDFDNELYNTLGNSNFSNVNRGKKKQSRESIFIDSYKKSYQEGVSAYKSIEDLYKTKARKISGDLIPLRLEIDSFFSFVRDRHAIHETWSDQEIGWNETHKQNLLTLVDEWLLTEWPHFECNVVPKNYPLINDILGSVELVNKSSAEDIVDALCVLHSFHDSLRFHKGGLETLKSSFISSNDINKIRVTISYLLYGKGDVVVRMANCIFNDEYKLNYFGRANVQELVGWINKENLPVINGRTTKVLRYFGFDIRQL